MMKEKYRKSLLIASAILSLLFLSDSKAQAQDNPKRSATPALQLLLLSENRPNIVFVTSTAYDGNLGGLVGADQKCQALAEAAGLPKNTYKAWLSTASVNAIDRLGSARGWVRVDGKPFADTKADISKGKVFYPIRVDERGNYDEHPSGSAVWTGTGYDGTLIGSEDTCTGWTSSSAGPMGWYGHTDGVAGVFTSDGWSTCDQPYHRLYCFGTGNQYSVAVKRVVGRIAFLTKDPWIPSGGLGAADQQCNQEAQQAGLSGSFKALLATEGASAASRFDLSGKTWVRPDGVAIAPTAAELFSAEFLSTAINQSADGLQYFGDYGVWTGASDPNVVGKPEWTCNNWTSSSGTDTAVGGISGYTYYAKSFYRYFSTCNDTSTRLYCLQE